MIKQILALFAIIALARSDAMIGSYLLLNTGKSATQSKEKLTGLIKQETLPFTRLYLAFIRPDLVYEKNSMKSTGMELETSGDYGFAFIKDAVSKLKAKGVEVYLSMGGWDNSCNPYFYMQYSIYQYGPSPNYWKIQQYGGGQPSGCTEENGFCYVCEPEFEPRKINDFAIWPTPTGTATWDAAVNYVKGKKSDADIHTFTPGGTFVDQKTGRTVPIPGNPGYITKKTDPYVDIVHIANDLGCDGIDFDYEEMWYADWLHTGQGPYKLDQSIYKQGAILYDLKQAVATINSNLKVSAAIACCGADGGNWWGGNLKGQLYWIVQYFPEAVAVLKSGGINIMTYDVSSNEKYHECPADQQSNCPLNKQVHYYMSQFEKFDQFSPRVGYEIGQPAYPDKTHDASHQLPLSTTEFNLIQSNTQASNKHGGFIWEAFKPTTSKGNVTPVEVLNGICKTVGGSICSGTLPATPTEEVTFLSE